MEINRRKTKEPLPNELKMINFFFLPPPPHLSLKHESRWGTRRFHNQFPPFSPVLHCPLGLCKLQACPFPDVVFPPLPVFALSSSPFHDYKLQKLAVLIRYLA